MAVAELTVIIVPETLDLSGSAQNTGRMARGLVIRENEVVAQFDSGQCIAHITRGVADIGGVAEAQLSVVIAS